jgi:UDP-N-acetylglucosamine 2-epimerase (non-hydrolysing)
MVLGIRPDIIRASKVIQILKSNYNEEFQLVWTGQHYSSNLKDIFFQELELKNPDIELEVYGTSDAEIVAECINKLYNYLIKAKPKVVVFLGDTNTVIGAIAAAQLNIPIIHIEGCMRSYDWRMPEEKYRTIVDHLADLIFAYTDAYKENGIAEGIRSENIIVTGNPIVEVLSDFVESKNYQETWNSALISRELLGEEFFLATCHRRENVESKKSLLNIFALLEEVNSKVIMPLSYRTSKQIDDFNIKIPLNVKIEEPIGYGEFVSLLKNSKGVITDSGTVVEEACILGIPSIQIRRSTERPEVYLVGSSIKYDPNSDASHGEIISKMLLLSQRRWKQPFGDGTASEKIAEEIINFERKSKSGHLPLLDRKNVQRSYISHLD